MPFNWQERAAGDRLRAQALAAEEQASEKIMLVKQESRLVNQHANDRNCVLVRLALCAADYTRRRLLRTAVRHWRLALALAAGAMRLDLEFRATLESTTEEMQREIRYSGPLSLERCMLGAHAVLQPARLPRSALPLGRVTAPCARVCVCAPPRRRAFRWHARRTL